MSARHGIPPDLISTSYHPKITPRLAGGITFVEILADRRRGLGVLLQMMMLNSTTVTFLVVVRYTTKVSFCAGIFNLAGSFFSKLAILFSL